VKTINIGEKIRREDLLRLIDEDSRVTYRVSGLSVDDLIESDMDALNETLLDDSVHNGAYLEDISYRFAGVSEFGTAIIEVNADARGWLQEDREES
jgi:hypothetical protein